jgi:heme iron utilization protein
LAVRTAHGRERYHPYMLDATIRAVQALLAQQRVLTLAVDAGGAPCAGLLPFAPLPHRTGVVVHASRLARHTEGLVDGARVGVLVHEADAPGKDPLQLQRITFDCLVEPLDRRSNAWQQARDLYLTRFPDAAVTFELGDFTLYRLAFQAGRYVAGFGRAIAIGPDDIARLNDAV